ncbi:hypothetical protein Lal_00026092, partial [Lupinus albus]
NFGSSIVANFGSSNVANFGSSNVANFGSSDVARFGSSDVARFGSSYVASFGSSDVASFGSSNVASFGSSDVASFCSSYVASFGSSDMNVYVNIVLWNEYEWESGILNKVVEFVIISYRKITYNPGWRNQAPFQNNAGHNRPSYVPTPIQQQRQQMINIPASNEPSLEELRQESSIQYLTTQMGQMTTSVNTLQTQNSDKLHSQDVHNPKNVSVMTLRSSKQTEVPTPTTNVELEKEHDTSKRNKSF